MKDWKKEFKKQFTEVERLDFGVDKRPVKDSPFLTEVLSFIESLLSEQESEHKKQMREAIRETIIRDDKHFRSRRPRG